MVLQIKTIILMTYLPRVKTQHNFQPSVNESVKRKNWLQTGTCKWIEGELAQ